MQLVHSKLGVRLIYTSASYTRDGTVCLVRFSCRRTSKECRLRSLSSSAGSIHIFSTFLLLYLQVLAPALNDNLRFHVFFVYTNQDQDWAESVVEKLESPRLGFKCCCPHRDLGAAGLTQPQVGVRAVWSARGKQKRTPSFFSTPEVETRSGAFMCCCA